MKTYMRPLVSFFKTRTLILKTQGTQQFSLSRTGDLGEDDACGGGEQNFNGWEIGVIQEGAEIKVRVVPDDTSTDDFSGGTDLVLRILDANGNAVTGCVDAKGIGRAEEANFIAPNTGTYEIHVHNNDFGNCNTCNPTYTLEVSGNQAQPEILSLEQTCECELDTCPHAPISGSCLFP